MFRIRRSGSKKFVSGIALFMNGVRAGLGGRGHSLLMSGKFIVLPALDGISESTSRSLLISVKDSKAWVISDAGRVQEIGLERLPFSLEELQKEVGSVWRLYQDGSEGRRWNRRRQRVRTIGLWSALAMTLVWRYVID